MGKDERKIVLWDLEDKEVLYYTSKIEAIEGILDNMEDPLPETIEICGYAKVKLPENFYTGNILEEFLERLDEEYGAPDDVTKPTEGMIAAEKEFRKAVMAEYDPFWCEVVHRETVDVKEWIRENRPDWLKV